MKHARVVWFASLLIVASATNGFGFEDTPWGEPTGGLASRLTLVTEQPKLGEPLLLRLEIKNVSDSRLGYDDQQAGVNHSLKVIGPDGAEVPYVGGSFQTSGFTEPLMAGATRTILAGLDLTAQYLVDRAGAYTIQSIARGGVPASNTLVVTVAPGRLADFQRVLIALRPTAPKGWHVARYGESIVWIHAPSGLKSDATSLALMFTKERVSPAPRQRVEYLGQTTLGHAWLTAENDKAAARWPDHVKQIASQLQPFQIDRDR